LVFLLATCIFTLPVSTFRAARRFRSNDLVYINTLTIIDYIMAGFFFRQKALLHVREIPTGASGYALRSLLRAARIPTIFNSKATRDALRQSPGTPSYVLYNGYEGPATYDVPDYRGDRPLRVLMLGRLSTWKGQDLLIEACSLLPAATRGAIDVRIVGSSFAHNTALEQSLHRLVDESGCSHCISFEPFTAAPESWYQWCDIAVVPSRLPEPFGRVPVEAMSFGRGSIVAGFGGLVETVEDGVTGWHAPPNDALALAGLLGRLIAEPVWVETFGRNARCRFERSFRQDIIDRKLMCIVEQHLGKSDSLDQKGGEVPLNLNGDS
jgi:glycosyltransferase involved in cell wall biosynthesis